MASSDAACLALAWQHRDALSLQRGNGVMSTMDDRTCTECHRGLQG